jgi:hypothetical protein
MINGGGNGISVSVAKVHRHHPTPYSPNPSAQYEGLKRREFEII